MSSVGRAWRRAAALLVLLSGSAASPRVWAADEAEADEAPADEKIEATSSSGATSQSVIIVVGAAGADEYARPFAAWADQWRDAAEASGARVTTIGSAPGEDAGESSGDDRTRLHDALAALASDEGAADVTWLVLIGHGSFDGKVSKFNLVGPDVSAGELKQWLAPIESPLAVVNCASASAPFLAEIAGPNRVIVTATKSGHELNYARFGQFLAAAIADPRADLDKDDQTSLLEAYLTASRDVAEFYAGEQRLATEHPLLDDNGDGLGTPADWFRGIRATQRPKEGAALDGLRAHQFHLVPSDREADMPREVRQRREALELQLAELRDRKPELGDDAYYSQLEPLLVELARLYASLSVLAEANEGTDKPPDASAVEPAANVVE
jgi:hypothetical protein